MLNVSKDLLSHPGETLREILEGMSITPMDLANNTNSDLAYVSMVLMGMSEISDEFASNLEKYLGISKDFWINMQNDYNEMIKKYNE